MCKFCEGLFDKKHEIIWDMRNAYADDNFCEKVLNNNCDNCKKCDIEYRLRGLIINNNSYIQCDYKFDNGSIIMWNFTELLPINYCPYCGRKISENIIDFNNISNYIVEMIDKEGD